MHRKTEIWFRPGPADRGAGLL